ELADAVVGPRSVGSAGRQVHWAVVVGHCPGDCVVGVGGITALHEAADEGPVGVIQGQAAAEDVDTPDPLSDHIVLEGAVVGRVTAIGDLFVGWVGFLESEQGSARLGGGIQIGSR